MNRKFEKVSEYNDFICYVILKAPNNFPEDSGTTLDSAFDDLKNNIEILLKRIKSEEQISVLREMLEMSYGAYIESDLKKAIYILQEFQGIVWPKFKMEPKYETEAANRIISKTA